MPTISPGSANLLLSTFAPEVDQSDVKVPGTAQLVLTTGLGDEADISPGSANLTLTTSAPVVAVTGIYSIEVPSANLRLTTSAPYVLNVISWPYEEFCPKRVAVNLTSETVSPGRSLTGKKQIIQSDSGFWHIKLGGLRIRTPQEVLDWRALDSAFNGRANAVLIPAYDGKRRPIPSDEDAIVATANNAVGRRKIAINIKMINGAAPEPGMHFSTNGRLYRLKTVDAPAGNPPVYHCTIRPPTREEIPIDAALEFDRPVCRCRLLRDDGMDILLQLMRLADPDVEFVEDI